MSLRESAPTLSGAASDPSSTGKPSVCLRDSTHALHRQVEATIPWRRFFQDLESYREFLDRYRQLIVAAQSHIEPWLADSSTGVGLTGMCGLLTEDLVSVDRMCAVGTARRPLFCWRSGPDLLIDWVQDAASAAGVLYVVRGSLNGGALLAGMARASLPLLNGGGLKFFQTAGNECVATWQTTQAWLDGFLVSEGDLRVAIASAQRAFLYFDEYLGVSE